MSYVRYPLQIGIAVVFTVLITLLGATLVWFHYTEYRALTLDAAADVLARIERQTGNTVRAMYAPAEDLVDLTARLDAIEATSLEERMHLLPYFAEALRLSGSLSSLYVGYDDGGFFQVRAVTPGDAVHTGLPTPAAARFVVVADQPGEGDRQRTLLFYDESLEQLSASTTQQTDFDPRTRPWYRAAIGSDLLVNSGIYRFHTPPVIGTTVARRSKASRAVVAADLTLATLSQHLAEQRMTPGSELVIFSADGQVIAYAGADDQVHVDHSASSPRGVATRLDTLDHPVLQALARQLAADPAATRLDNSIAGRDWLGSVTTLQSRSGNPVSLAILVPRDELLAGITSLRTTSTLISLTIVVIAILAAWWLAHHIAKSLRALSGEASRIRQFHLESPITVRSRFVEVDELAQIMGAMKSAIHHFVDLSKGLSAEKDFDRLLEKLLTEARTACRADGGSILLYDERDDSLATVLAVNVATQTHLDTDAVRTAQATTAATATRDGPTPIEAMTIRRGQTQVIDDIDAGDDLDFSRVRDRFERDGYRCRSLLQLPLRNRQDEIIGLLELVNARDRTTGELTGFTAETVSYVEAFSSQAAITLDNRRLLQAQKDLLDALIQLIAGAIDAKSPYTSGHCQRVPELARMLADAAEKAENGPFAAFSLNEDERYQLHIASWLHDCGKVTTPEHVVDKATKLACIYDRIHEIRMRFEVLWRDAQVEGYRAVAAGEADDAQLRQRLDANLEQLREDFAFVADCNIGGEFMAPEKVQRLRQIGSTTWLRYFDDRIGLSHDELQRKQRRPPAPLPAVEHLLADKPEHVIERDDGGSPFGDNHLGFRMDVPAHAFNHGELYNLGVARGTLTDEDRFKINEHIVQTLMMLDRLPFPRELRRVPDWAGNHHEKLDGTGYPRRRTAAELSIPERIMAIADIFEALTAADRPYKQAKTLSESLRIMAAMRDDGHICPDLFALFLRAGVYRAYARAFLAPQQIDEVDIGPLLASAGRPD